MLRSLVFKLRSLIALLVSIATVFWELLVYTLPARILIAFVALIVTVALVFNACSSNDETPPSSTTAADPAAISASETSSSTTTALSHTTRQTQQKPEQIEPSAVEPSTNVVEPDAIESNAVVERVVDGDTVIAQIRGVSESVRLIGIDTPESVARNRPVECYGKEASEYTKQLLPVGTDIMLVLDVEHRDIYKRLLAYIVRVEDSLFINLDLVAEGYADVLTYPPNTTYEADFERAKASAKASGKGLWGACGGPDVPLNPDS